MGDYPTDLLGWADEMDRSADGCREAGFPQVVEEGNRFLAKLLRQAAAENAALRERVAVLERVREAAIVADDFVWGTGSDPYMDPKTTVPWVGQFHKVRDGLREALAAAKPAAQEGKEQQP